MYDDYAGDDDDDDVWLWGMVALVDGGMIMTRTMYGDNDEQMIDDDVIWSMLTISDFADDG